MQNASPCDSFGRRNFEPFDIVSVQHAITPSEADDLAGAARCVYEILDDTIRTRENLHTLSAQLAGDYIAGRGHLPTSWKLLSRLCRMQMNACWFPR